MSSFVLIFRDRARKTSVRLAVPRGFLSAVVEPYAQGKERNMDDIIDGLKKQRENR